MLTISLSLFLYCIRQVSMTIVSTWNIVAYLKAFDKLINSIPYYKCPCYFIWSRPICVPVLCEGRVLIIDLSEICAENFLLQSIFLRVKSTIDSSIPVLKSFAKISRWALFWFSHVSILYHDIFIIYKWSGSISKIRRLLDRILQFLLH